MKRKYDHSGIVEVFKSYGASVKEFATWCGMTEAGVCLRFQKEMKKGFSKETECLIYGFFLERNGFKISHEMFNYE